MKEGKKRRDGKERKEGKRSKAILPSALDSFFNEKFQQRK